MPTAAFPQPQSTRVCGIIFKAQGSQGPLGQRDRCACWERGHPAHDPHAPPRTLSPGLMATRGTAEGLRGFPSLPHLTHTGTRADGGAGDHDVAWGEMRCPRPSWSLGTGTNSLTSAAARAPRLKGRVLLASSCFWCGQGLASAPGRVCLHLAPHPVGVCVSPSSYESPSPRGSKVSSFHRIR